jgi:hypothetical protein
MLTPEQRSQRARIGGLTRASRYDSHEVTRPAKLAFQERFRRQVREAAAAAGEQLPEVEVERRTKAALDAYMVRLAYRSSRARQAKASP